MYVGDLFEVMILTASVAAMPPLPPSPPPPAPPQLKDDEAIISPHFMAQLLQHGMGIGNRGEVWSGADLERDAKVCLLLWILSLLVCKISDL